MSLQERVDAFRTRFKLTSHHTIERFGIMVAFLLISFLIVGTGAGVSAFTSTRHDRDNTVLYTGEFTTSKVSRSGETSGVFVNDDKSQALVLMKFTDIAAMPKDASQYATFLTGYTFGDTKRYITQPVSAQTIVFGSTGYMGVLFTSDRPFEPMVYTLTIRNKANITTGEERMSENEIQNRYGGDTTFAEYEQWRIGFNPTADQAQPLKTLNSYDVQPSELYNELLIAPEEHKLREEAQKDLETLKADLNAIESAETSVLKTKVDNISVTMPPMPRFIQGDKIEGNEPSGSDPVASSTLSLKTDNVFPGGWDYNWRDGSVEEGYLDDIVPQGQSYVDFLQAHKDEDNSADTSVGNIVWTLSNGEPLTEDTEGGPLQPLVDAKVELEGAMEKYLTDKEKYQKDTLGGIIDLEVQMRSVESASTVNASAEDFEVY